MDTGPEKNRLCFRIGTNVLKRDFLKMGLPPLCSCKFAYTFIVASIHN